MITVQGDVAVVRTGDIVTVMFHAETDTALDLRSILAKFNSEGVGDTSPEVRQLLRDAEAALQSTFRVKRPRVVSSTTIPLRVVESRPRKVCQIPDCGCSGYAHP